MGDLQENEKLKHTPKKILVKDIIDYIHSLSKEMNIVGTQGIAGNELELIALVRNCKFLYDRNQPDFKDVRKKNAAWNTIAKVLNAHVQEVQQRWRYLREMYNRYKKEMENTNNLDYGHVRLWEFYEDMKFIEPYILHRKSTKLNISSVSSEESEDNGKEDAPEMSYSNETPADILKFISEIESRPILYDNKHLHFKNKEYKMETWKEVSQVFGLSVEDCEHKWKRLRERYGRERKHLQQGNDEGKCWQYFEALSFLDSFVKSRRQPVYIPFVNKSSQEGSSLQVFQVNSDADSNYLIKDEHTQNAFNLSNTVQMSEDVRDIEFIDTINPRSFGDLTCSSFSDNQLHKSVQASPETFNQRPPDEDDLFGQMIAAELRAMPRGKKKMKLKADMYRLLYENESDE